MCGIVGYVGGKKAQDFLLSGLKRLEYRGYDSAGVVTLDEKGQATLAKAEGKIAELEKKLAKQRTTDKIGIGHTRWATHGEPSEVNAHPHQVGQIFLVHNGIIENYKELKKILNEKGGMKKFKSETDSEVLAGLINMFYKENQDDLVGAVVQALKLTQGTYGIAVVSEKNPDEIVVARSGSPLVIGVGNDETLIASDASALIGHTRRAIYLNDGEVARVTKDSIEVKTLEAEPAEAKVEEIETNLAAIQKGGYEHFLLKEIMEQPESLAETLRGRVNEKTGVVKLGGPGLSEAELRKIEHIIIIGCGTAYNAGMLASYYIERMVPEVTVEVAIASEYRYRQAYIPKNSVALIVSQSGETADTLACLREIKKQGVKTIGVVNVIGSTIAREVDGGTYVHVGPEISVASTKAFTSQAMTMVMFGLTIAEAKGVNEKTVRPLIREIAKMPAEIKKVLEELQQETEKLAGQYKKYEHAIYLGRGTAYPIAMEGALKIKEISYIDANAYAFGELKHGPLALVDDRFFEVVFLAKNELYEKSVSNIEEVLARGGHVIVITDAEDFDLPVENVVKITTKFEMLVPMLMNLGAQLFAYYMALERGENVDQPRNLAKSVTVE